jgi:formyltetrahydrofolate deformylase
MEIRIRLPEPNRRQRMAIMVTREPHCLDALIKAMTSGVLRKAQPALVLSNRGDLGAIADKAGLPFKVLSWGDRIAAEAKALRLLEQHEIDFVVLARFMKILSPNFVWRFKNKIINIHPSLLLSPNFVWRFKNKIINIHPSLLPSFPGSQAYRQAYERGVKIIGVSAHFVTMDLDEGPIIAQDSFDVRPNMNLAQIVAAGQKLEARTLVRAVKLYLEKRLDVYWGVVKEV